ncbi:acyl-CoA dehydratase activase-related protein [Alkaliphilus hydrothermalis]|uniref:Nucleotide-binding protein (Sugar kinase/HSP70/actin superfamily) n=1 Tax=Alkaliphilus hydrothermalis TaxID=1482730 RepID=A0ABS2NT02_9FIRM|nr:putative nucleotide-binding protein (sugar kinase/HSP70/actin superfamily) [Alkaliphilus hydrothermalis]
MKVGIPQSLLYSYYYPLWKTYFEALGIEVVATPTTTKEIMDLGVKNSVPELCVPIKVYIGHVLKLEEMEVDYIYVPRFVSISKGQYFCPKFMGLPDMIRYSFPDIVDKLIIPTIEAQDENIAHYKNFRIFEEIFKITPKENRAALRKAEGVWLTFRSHCLKGYTAMEAMDLSFGEIMEEKFEAIEEGVTIGLVGYVYNVYDPFISMDIVKKIRSMGVGVKTFEMLEENEINRQLKYLQKNLFWTFSDKILASGYSFYNDEDVDGLIHFTAFGCGPDSMLGKLLEMESPSFRKPFMTIRVDEHSGENHLQTRIEAFVDMLRRKKQKSRRGA